MVEMGLGRAKNSSAWRVRRTATQAIYHARASAFASFASFAAVLTVLCDAPVLHRSAHPFELQAMAIGTHCCGLLVGITEFDRKLLVTVFCTGNVPNGRRKSENPA